jgi:hypothetical protein
MDRERGTASGGGASNVPDDLDLDATYDLVLTGDADAVDAGTIHEAAILGRWVLSSQRLMRRSEMVRGGQK